MSLPSKKSRLIVIDNIKYRYIISTTLIDDNWNFKLNITIQIAKGNGAALSIQGLITRDFWLDFSDSPFDMNNYPIVLPSHIAKFIQQAIIKGWNPKIKGKLFILNLDNRSVF